MPAEENGKRNFWDATVRLATVIGAALAMIWIGFAGVLVAVRDPYLIPALPFVGIGGLACCIGALACVLGNPSKPARFPLCLRAFGWLSGAMGMAFLLWTLGRPSGIGFGPEVILIGVILSGAAILGTVGMVVFSLFLIFTREEDGAQSARIASDGSSAGAEVALDSFEPNKRVIEGAA